MPIVLAQCHMSMVKVKHVAMSYYIDFQKADFNTSWQFTRINFWDQGHKSKVKDA